MIPRLRSWIRAVVLGEENGISKETHLRPSLAEETAAAAKAAATAAADMAKASEELLNSKLQGKLSTHGIGFMHLHPSPLPLRFLVMLP